MDLKRHLRIILLVLTSTIVGSAGSFLVLSFVLSQPAGEPSPYVSNFQWQNYHSHVLVKGIIVNPRTTEVSNATLAFNVYVEYIYHDIHAIKRYTLLKRETISFGNLAKETTKDFSAEIPYDDTKSASFRFSYVSCELSWTQ